MELHVVAATRPATDDNMADDGRLRSCHSISKVVNNPVSLIAEKHKKNVALVVYRKEDKNAAVYAADIREDNMPDPENPLDVN
ncbi:hypothetical protein F441_21677 [Phytophthora nicotianae CJ01A1]|uniref:Uncharacterized protein n=4 Tax=Phytophthora nicotianae TaxID=4792 RepID=V9DYV4_PHYNI|nr:hypothetical protein F443_21796 [Phytophthora nicotianae P1569]ETK71595.1 hypothetical protein L915_21189 [Phytophthora nicotianae]ETO59914.1 hypothetical protein F444_21819 [Phytophthora nicotianae P1976]ETP01008.1 hypothetical protein F441_21677 [Phytophthora nicotianae CJ01A1]ETL25034.1 hypothetical protein L916_21061 [Phytophthora nicotianae]